MTALAESGTVSLGYGQTDNGSDTLDSLLVNGTYSTDFANGLMIDLTGRANLLDAGGDEAEIYNVFGSVGYQFQNGLTAGAYLQRFSFVDTFVGKLDSYGLSLGYAAAGVDVAAYVGETKSVDFGDTFDEWGLHAGYRTGSLGVYGSYQNLEFPNGDELTATGLAGHYKVTPEIALFGGAMSIDDVGNTLEGGGIGASYKIPGAFSRRALVLSGEYRSISDFAGSDPIDGFSLMLTMPFGEADAAVPDQSIAGTVANPGYSTFGTVYDSLF